MFSTDFQIARAVKLWLLTGLVMIFIQIVIGGVTRLTGSGLSITRWEVVTGSIPPLNAAAWTEAFELYKQTPQYQKINQGMSLSDFKFIFFWEYFHRLWARLMFFVFIIPFFWFLWRGMLSKRLLPRLLAVVALAGLEGFFGWIMVASGLIKRPWVNAYNLTLHLTMALIIFSYLLWTYFIAAWPRPVASDTGRQLRRFSWGLVVLAFVQIALGAMMSGSKAGLFYPTWPDMQGSYLPSVLLDANNWQAAHFIDYDTYAFMPALIQFLHRNTAYLLTILIGIFCWKLWKTVEGGGWKVEGRGEKVEGVIRWSIFALLAALTTQVLLGIFTLLGCKGSIPVVLGVLHQAGAVVLLTILLFVTYQIQAERLKSK
jgi:cytochrome c oxidase assembly protein subunit 15